MATETITIEALFRDSGASEGVDRLESKLGRLGSRLAVLNTEMQTRAHSALTSFKTNLSGIGDTLAGVEKKLDSVIDKIGEKLWSATKLGVIGVVGLGSAFMAMAVNIEKEVQNAQLTLANFMGVSPNNAQVTTMVQQMHSSAWIASLTAQTQGMKQLLVNPSTRGQASQLNSALLSIAAMNPGNSEQSYSALASTYGRIEQMGRVQGRAGVMLGRAGIAPAELAQQMGLGGIMSTPAGARAFQQLLGTAMTPQQIITATEQLAQKYTGWDPNAPPGTLSRTEANMANGSISGAEAFAKNQISVTLGDSLKQMDFAGLIMQMVGPVQSLVGTLSTTIVPPVVGFLKSLVTVGNELLPVVSPLIKAFAGALASGVSRLAGYGKQLQQLGSGLGTAFQRFLSAAMPLLPAFFTGLIAILNVLPPFITAITPVMAVFAHTLEILAKIAAFATSIAPVSYALGGIAAGLVGILAAAKVVSVFRDMAKWMEEMNKAGGLIGWLKKSGKGGAEGSEKVLKSTVAEMTVDVMYVKDQIGGGGGLGGNLGKDAEKEAGKLGEKAAKKGAEDVLKNEGEHAAEAAAGGSVLRRLFPTLFRGGGALKGGQAALSGLKDTAYLKGLYGLDKLKGLGALGGDALGADAGTALYAGGASAAGTVGAVGIAGVASFLGTTALLNAHKKGADRVLNDTLGWTGLHWGDNAKGPQAHLTKKTDDFVKEFMKDNKALIAEGRKSGEIHGKDAWEALRYYNSLSAAQKQQAGWVNPDDPNAGPGATPTHFNFNAPITVVANDPADFERQLQNKAKEQERRGARVPTVKGNQGSYNRIVAGRPAS